MTLNELHQAIKELLEQGGDGDDPVAIDLYGQCCELTSISMVVASDVWEAGTIVITADLIEEGEADDG